MSVGYEAGLGIFLYLFLLACARRICPGIFVFGPPGRDRLWGVRLYTRTTVAGLIWSEIQLNTDLDEAWEQRICGWGQFPYVKQHLVNEGVKKIEIGKGNSGLSAKWVVHKKTDS